MVFEERINDSQESRRPLISSHRESSYGTTKSASTTNTTKVDRNTDLERASISSSSSSLSSLTATSPKSYEEEIPVKIWDVVSVLLIGMLVFPFHSYVRQTEIN
jgi:hypothetical protein